MWWLCKNKLNRSEVPLMSIYLIFFPRLIWNKAGSVVRHMSQLGGPSLCLSCFHCLSQGSLFCMLTACHIVACWVQHLNCVCGLWANFVPWTSLLDLGDDINIIESLHADILWWVTFTCTTSWEIWAGILASATFMDVHSSCPVIAKMKA